MFKLFARKKKLVTFAMAGMLAATAFNPTGCSFNIDEQFLQNVLDQVSNIDWEATFHASGHEGSGGPPSNPGDDCGDGGQDCPDEG